MGNNAGKEEIKIQNVLPSYAYPQPPLASIDEIRPPIPWYQDNETDEFDWSSIEIKQASDDNSSWAPEAADYYATYKTPKTVFIATPQLMGPLTNRPMLTASGRHISFMHQERSRHLVLQRGSSTISNISARLQAYNHKRATYTGIINFDSIDQHARKATVTHSQSFSDLALYLKQPITYHRFADLMMARALVVWLAFQKIKASVFVKPTITKPSGILQLLAREKMSYAQAYVLLCRGSGLDCVLIEGVSKPSLTEPGVDLREMFPDTWTAVFVDGNWQLVHPFLVCKGIFWQDSVIAEWINREIKSVGKKRTEDIQRVKDLVKLIINEDFFMPNPEVFIHSNYSDDIRWQLLSPEFTLNSRDEFNSLPFVYPAFFRLGFRFISAPSSVIEAIDGKCKLWFSNELKKSHRLTLTYELHLLETNYQNTQILLPHLHKLVLHCRHNDLFYFEVRLPIQGVFLLDIKGGFHQAHFIKLCVIKILCDKPMNGFRYLPYSPDLLMWGPGPMCIDTGLVLPSRPTGVVKCYPMLKSELNSCIIQNNLRQPQSYRTLKFSFHLHPVKAKYVDYHVDLLGSLPDDHSESVTPLDEQGQLKNTRGRTRRHKGEVEPEKPDYSFALGMLKKDLDKRFLIISVTVPHEGEFALLITASEFSLMPGTEIKEFKDAQPVCVYLIRTVDDTNRESVHQKIARSELQVALMDIQTYNIRKAINKCIKVKINPNDDEIAAAETKLEFLNYRKEINDAIHRRNYRIINETLLKISKYRYRGALVYEIRRLFKLRKQLKRLLECQKDVPTLREAASEIVQIVDPPPEIHLTIGALFLLVEEPEKYIESWDYIVHQMTSEHGRQGDPTIFAKMNLIAEMFPSNNTRRKIVTLLAEYNVEQVKRVSPAAAKFYTWIEKVMAILQDLEFYFERLEMKEQVPANNSNVHNI